MGQKKAFFSILLLVVTTLFFIAGYILISIQTQKTESEIQRQLIHSANVLLAALNPERVERLTGTILDLESPDYIRIKEQMSKLGEVFDEDNIASFYVMRKVGEKILFLADSLSPNSDDYSPPGEAYTQPDPVLFSVFDQGAPRLTGPYTDEYGTFVSYFAPVRSFSNNLIVGVIGVDIDHDAYIASIRGEQIKNFLFIFLIYILSIGIVFFFARRNESQKQLHENEERLRVIAETVPDAIIMMDDKGNISFWNRAAERILGYSESEAMHKNLHELIAPKDLYDIEHSKNLFNFMSTGNSPVLNKTVEVEIQTKEKKRKRVELSVGPLKMHNRWYAIGSMRDITDRDEQNRKMKIQADELEKLNKFMLNREEKMIELKAEIEKLKKNQT